MSIINTTEESTALRKGVAPLKRIESSSQLSEWKALDEVSGSSIIIVETRKSKGEV